MNARDVRRPSARHRARRALRQAVLLCALTGLVGRPPAQGQEPVVLDAFESSGDWVAAPADGVRLDLSSVAGRDGQSLRMAFDFQGQGGYAIARRDLALDLPEAFEISVWLRAESPINNLEIKLLDPTRENVWWVNRRDYSFPATWTQLRFKRRHFEFAWGPTDDRTLRRIGAIEIVVTAGSGGRGWVELDSLGLRTLPSPPATAASPAASATSEVPGNPARAAIDASRETAWTPSPDDRQPTLTVDLGGPREFGGLTLWWQNPDASRDWSLSLSDDGIGWRQAASVAGARGPRDDLQLADEEARFLRVILAEGLRSAALTEVEVRDLAFGATPNALLQARAREGVRGEYPRAFLGEQSYWTVVGVPGAREEALLSEDGAFEVGRREFSIEPFLEVAGEWIGWSSVTTNHRLEERSLPIPTVIWRHALATLEITALAVGGAADSSAWLRYRVVAPGDRGIEGSLYLTIRPMQVNPPSQFLNGPGGIAKIASLSFHDGVLQVDRRPRVAAITPNGGFVGAAFDQGSFVGRLPSAVPVATGAIEDRRALASGAIVFPLRLPRGGIADFVLAVPLGPSAAVPPSDADAQRVFARLLATQVAAWKQLLRQVEVRLPAEGKRLGQILETAQAHIWIHQDGAALQPGSRSYERSWIRDGALTSSALLRLGHLDAVRRFLLWFAERITADGKVPCCVDARGADPVPENDSHGEFLHLAAQYLRFSGDRATLEALWPRIRSVVGYLDALRAQRRTARFRGGPESVAFGLLPESISHEGYSDKPRHSFWDDFWALRGYKDAVEMAQGLGSPDEANRWSASRDEFRSDLYTALARVVQEHAIDYLPGCVELADFDPTSSTIAVEPGGERRSLPDGLLEATFERWANEAAQRADGTRSWEGYTPYEWRSIGVLWRLGWSQRAHDLIPFFLDGMRPAAWNQWGEVVYREQRTARFIGDMPHGWVASDFIRTLLDGVAFEDESDGSLVLGAGLREAWLDDPAGITVRSLRTRWGRLSYESRPTRRGFRIDLRIEGRTPPGGFVLSGPLAQAARLRVNGRALARDGQGAWRVRASRARLEAEWPVQRVARDAARPGSKLSRPSTRGQHGG